MLSLIKAIPPNSSGIGKVGVIAYMATLKRLKVVGGSFFVRRTQNAAFWI